MEQISLSSHLTLVTVLTGEIDRLRTQNEQLTSCAQNLPDITQRNAQLTEENARLELDLEHKMKILQDLKESHEELQSKYADLREVYNALTLELEAEKSKHNYSK